MEEAKRNHALFASYDIGAAEELLFFSLLYERNDNSRL